MANWGESMSYFHGLWGEYNTAAGAQAAAAARRIAADNPKTTEREMLADMLLLNDQAGALAEYKGFSFFNRTGSTLFTVRDRLLLRQETWRLRGFTTRSCLNWRREANVLSL
jgi:hypothetical protein